MMGRADPFAHDDEDFEPMDAPAAAPEPPADLFAPPVADLSAEAPNGAKTEAAPAHLSPAALRELARIMASPSIGAATERRILSYLRHGHTIDDDRDRPLFDLPRKARQYLSDGLELVAADKGGPATSADQAERRARALVKLATATALLMAAHDALAWACALEANNLQTRGE
jgi:hypothetical protein